MINTFIKSSFHRVPNQQAAGTRESLLIMLDYITELVLKDSPEAPHLTCTALMGGCLVGNVSPSTLTKRELKDLTKN